MVAVEVGETMEAVEVAEATVTIIGHNITQFKDGVHTTITADVDVVTLAGDIN